MSSTIPYVGPRAFEIGETLYGRERELRQLISLLVAERIVLLHAPSGAGKTSLIQAGLIPQLQLEEYGFDVLPVMKVGREPPPGISTTYNRYVLSAIQFLEEEGSGGEVTESHRLQQLNKLAGLTLDEYLSRGARAEELSKVLIFDQFEEIITTVPTDRDGKEEFFSQLGIALRNRDRWALFAIREDYMGALAPYVRPIPDRLDATYRLDLLEHEAARQAIQKPANVVGIDFTDSAANILIKDLSQVQIQKPEGGYEPQVGQYIEPVQLQVVCLNLWKSGAADDGKIDEKDLERVGSVDEALALYYSDSIKDICQKTAIEENNIRRWFSDHLITLEGIRSQVLKGTNYTEGLPNNTLTLLEKTHIIRAERRAGRIWFELSHDRLVVPIRQDNSRWFEANLSLFRKQAVHWVTQDRPESLLLRGQELQQAEQEAQSTTITKEEGEFLVESKKAHQREQRDKKINRLIRSLAVIATLAFFAAIFLWMQANTAKGRAENAVSISNSALTAAEAANATVVSSGLITQADALAGLALAQLLPEEGGAIDLGQLLAVEAYHKNKAAKGENILPNVYQSLIYSAYRRDSRRIPNSFSAAAFSPDGKWVLVDDVLWNLENDKNIDLEIDSKHVFKIVFATEKDAVLLAENDYYPYSQQTQSRYTAYLFNIDHPSEIREIPLSSPAGAEVTDIELSDKGRWVAITYKESTNLNGKKISSGVQVWNLQDPSVPYQQPNIYIPPKESKALDMNDVVISPDEKNLAAFDNGNKHITYWRLDTDNKFEYIGAHPLKYNLILSVLISKNGSGLQYSPDSNWLLAVNEENATKSSASIFKVSAEKTSVYKILPFNNESLLGFLFSPDSKYLIGVTSSYSYCGNNPGPKCQPVTTVRSWQVDTGTPPEDPEPSVIYQSKTKEITSMYVSDNGIFVIGDDAGYVQAWRLGEKAELFENYKIHNRNVDNIIVGGPEGMVILSADDDKGTYLWKLVKESFEAAAAILPTDNTGDRVVHKETTHELVIAGSSTTEEGIINLLPELQEINDPNAIKDLPIKTGHGAIQEIAIHDQWIITERVCIDQRNDNYYYLDLLPRSNLEKGGGQKSVSLESAIGSLAFSPEEKYLAAAYNTGKIQVYETASLNNIGELIPANQEECPQMISLSSLVKPVAEFQSNLTDKISLQFTQSSSHYYLIGASTGGVQIWNMNNFLTEANPYQAISPAIISYDQKWLATGSAENAIQGTYTNAIQLYDLSNIHSSPVILPASTDVTKIAFSQDDQWLAAATKTGEILIYHLLPDPENTPAYKLTNITTEITWLEFSSKGLNNIEWLAASSGSVVFLYNMKNPYDTPLTLPHSGHGDVKFVSFTSQGEWVISFAKDKTLWFWSMDPDRLRNTACAYSGRNLMLTEWERYFPDQVQNYTKDGYTCGTMYPLDQQSITKVDITPQPYPTAGIPLTSTSIPATATSLPIQTPVLEMTTYIVKEGDTLSSIAVGFNIDMNLLAQDNNIENTNFIFVGQTLKIRGANTPSPP